MSNPYQNRPDYCFWSKEIADVKPAQVMPYVKAKHQIDKTTKVATAGSCFAQNISRYLAKSGYNYYVAEPMPAAFRKDISARLNFGVYSARYGNIYTTRQLRQLLEECFHNRQPKEKIWKRGTRFVDPLRPTITASGHLREQDVINDRQAHLTAVREMFETLDVFVFTLGLTEGWRSTDDETVFPVVPGTRAGGEFDAKKYEFFNQSYPEIHADLVNIRAMIKEVNPKASFILTVSPVPLVATMEDRSVLTSTGYSKATLRAVAGDMEKQFDDISYFPSYEIITAAFNRGAYFQPDLRNATEEGVRHAMRVFFEHFAKDETPNFASQKSDLLRGMKAGEVTIGKIAKPAQDDTTDQDDASQDDAQPDFVDLVCDELLNDGSA